MRLILRVYWKLVVQDDLNEVEKRALTQRESGNLSRSGDAIIYKYTSGPNWWCTRINLLLALDKLDAEYALYIKKLNYCIIYQSPKHHGKVYRGALHSPIEIFIFAFKKIFYIPSFTSTSISRDGCFWDPWDEEKTQKNLQNVMFEIDISDYNDKTTLIKPHQTEYSGESECLLSCYNIYAWQGYSFDVKNNVPLVRLKLLNYSENSDPEKGSIKGQKHGDIPVIWLEKKGEIPRTREMSPIQLDYHLKLLFDSYERNRKKEDWHQLDWLNAQHKQ